MITTDHNKIREWAEERDGLPAVVSAGKDGESGLLRIDFGEKEEGLEEVSWDEFFKIFDDNNLAFLYQDESSVGGLSRFFKFIDRHSVVEDDADTEETLEPPEEAGGAETENEEEEEDEEEEEEAE